MYLEFLLDCCKPLLVDELELDLVEGHVPGLVGDLVHVVGDEDGVVRPALASAANDVSRGTGTSRLPPELIILGQIIIITRTTTLLPQCLLLVLTLCWATALAGGI